MRGCSGRSIPELAVDELESVAPLTKPLVRLGNVPFVLFSDSLADVLLVLRPVASDELLRDDPALAVELLAAPLDMLPLLFIDEAPVAPVVLLLVPALPLVCAMAAPPAMPMAAIATTESLRMAFI